MKLFDIIKKVGGSALKNIVPGAAGVIDFVNELSDGDNQLGPNATGDEIHNVISKLPADQRASVLEKEYDVQITKIKEENETVRAVLNADKDNPQSTRPYIAKHSFHVIGFSTVMANVIWAYAVWDGDDKLVDAVVNGWPFVAAINAPLVTVLLRYFGVIAVEHKDKLDAAGGKPTAPSGILGVIGSLIKK